MKYRYFQIIRSMDKIIPGRVTTKKKYDLKLNSAGRFYF